MTHPLDIKYIEEMLPNISSDIVCGNFNNLILSYDDALTRSGELALYGINSVITSSIFFKFKLQLFLIYIYARSHCCC